MKLENKKSGFTLIEVMITVIVASVLTSLAIPRFTGALERVRVSEGVKILSALLQAQKVYQIENGYYATFLSELDVEFSNAENFVLPPWVDHPGDPVANPIAFVQRTGGYILGINELGTIMCSDFGAITCAEAGY